MTFDELSKIEKEADRVQATYEVFNEDTRLTRSRSAGVEFLTTVRTVESVLRPGARILDLGAGTGSYSFYFAKKGHPVTAVELAPRNAAIFRSRLRPELPIELIEGSALDLSALAPQSFDIVLLFGPLYHLEKKADRLRCLAEALRVMKPEGTLFAAFIANDMVPLTEFVYDPAFWKGDSYDHDTFRIRDFPFVFATLDECRSLLREAGLTVRREVASDGVSELLADRIDALDDESFAQYLRYHFHCCEKPEMLGRSNHLLFAAEKAGRDEDAPAQKKV